MEIEERPLKFESENESVKLSAPFDECSGGAFSGFVMFKRGYDERYDAENDAAYLESRHRCCYRALFSASSMAIVSCLSRQSCGARGNFLEVILPAAGLLWLDPYTQL